MLTLALGGIEVLKQDILSKYVIVQGGYVINLMGYTLLKDSHKLSVNGDAVIQSLSGANWGQAPVVGVNLSLRFNMQAVKGNFEGLLKDRPNVLFVFAAGNDKQNLEIWEAQPAGWGGEKNENAITVGAVDADGAYWVGSNWGAPRVDLAAPGCSVPVLGWNVKTNTFDETRVNGTSVAAPLVSFVGNLLRSLADPPRIKGRLLSSGRYLSNLTGKVRSSRVLDAPVALAHQFDAIRDQNGRLRLGHVDWPGGQTICGAEKPRDQIAQLSFDSTAGQGNTETKGKPFSAVFKNRDLRQISFPSCDLIKGELSDIVFREGVLGTDPPIYLKNEIEHLDIRKLQGVTFCDDCYNFPNN